MFVKSFFVLTLVTLFFIGCNNATQNAKAVINTNLSDTCCVKDTVSKKTEPALQSVITCPKCGYKKTETMPTDVCLLKYTCQNCKAELRPKHGDCCVFCTYGTKKCPSMQ
jgi:hypothetical protein